ncbi:YtxH domain-containing protein [Winogradskyella vincentii]|uniref:YtxH domain-containing protein n=1 Tax=Winogradskyella vincentii TaxID=2877122 RepID=A0ABS7XY37_9FLAO|nr:YtxH domain-containing protein [Winogradskyella vincentii]MCA0152583.1 YtxH domain-containing protein [Winogradskyella vincentii]
MSDDNKDLKDDLDDMIGDAKESAKKAGDKISQKASEIADDAKELAGEAKEKAAEFADDAKEVLSDGKNIAIIAHLTIIGWVIALVMNSNNKTEIGSFYIRQMLGFLIILFVSSWVPILNLIVIIVLFIAWLMSLIGAFGGEKKTTFLLGNQFQDWFKSL